MALMYARCYVLRRYFYLLRVSSAELVDVLVA